MQVNMIISHSCQGTFQILHSKVAHACKRTGSLHQTSSQQHPHASVSTTVQERHAPMCLIFPAALHSSSAARVSSSGTSAGNGRSGYLSVLTAARDALTGKDTATVKTNRLPQKTSPVRKSSWCCTPVQLVEVNIIHANPLQAGV